MSDTSLVFAAGFVIARRLHDEWEYLLLRNARHATWGPPKGHREQGEDNPTCARRELAEETGLTEITVLPGFTEVSTYAPRGERDGGSRKQVTFFLATVEEVEITQSAEHDEVRWVNLEEALQLLQFDSLRDIFRSAAGQL